MSAARPRQELHQELGLPLRRNRPRQHPHLLGREGSASTQRSLRLRCNVPTHRMLYDLTAIDERDAHASRRPAAERFHRRLPPALVHDATNTSA